MAYNIQLLSNSSLPEKLYFFDANLWLKILQPSFNPKKRDLNYSDFFQKFKKHNNQPKIALTALVISEVINRLLRDFAFNKFLDETNLKRENLEKDFYKKTYRSTEHFRKYYHLFCDDILSYSSLYEVVNDEFGSGVKQIELLQSPPKGLDFNDHYYYLLAKHYNIPIVTDDADFFVEDVTILTFNEILYRKGKDNIKPKV